MDTRTTPVRARQQATYQDVLDAPPHMVAEVLAGTLCTQPRLTMPHAWANSRLFGQLDGPFNPADGTPGCWCIVFEPELHLGQDILVADLAGWRHRTMPDYPPPPDARSPPIGSARHSLRQAVASI